MAGSNYGGGGRRTNGDDEITEIRVPPGREMTVEEQENFLARLLAEGSIGHDGWLVPLLSGERGGGKKDG